MLREQAEKERRMVLEVERRKKNPVVLEAKPEPEEEEGRVYQWWCPSSEKGRCSFRRWTVSRDIPLGKASRYFRIHGRAVKAHNAINQGNLASHRLVQPESH
jgi:hypothetical protein